MQALIVTIRSRDWVLIGILSLLFSVLLSLVCYFLVDEMPSHGFMFGCLLGLTLFVCAFLFTTTLNQHILPLLHKRYWLMIAGISSFFSGFLGTIFSYFLSQALHVKLLSKFESNVILFSFFIGLLTCVVAFLLYQFVVVTYAKEYQEKLLMSSRLKSLERQLNPHFLFNALNSMTELLHIDTQKAENALLSLCDFLRFSMKENARIRLQEELENVERYIFIENIRFNHAIFLETSIDSKFYEYLVPKFSIQLIVENAIKHGYNAKPLKIFIEATMGEFLILSISNDGKPIQTKQFGIGLSNLEERLTLLSKGRLSLIKSEPTTFTITLKELT